MSQPTSTRSNAPEINACMPSIKRMLSGWHIDGNVDVESIESGPMLPILFWVEKSWSCENPSVSLQFGPKSKDKPKWHCSLQDRYRDDLFAVVDKRGVVDVGLVPDAQSIRRLVRSAAKLPGSKDIALLVLPDSVAVRAAQILCTFRKKRFSIVVLLNNRSTEVFDDFVKACRQSKDPRNEVYKFCQHLEYATEGWDWCGVLRIAPESENVGAEQS